MGDLPPPPFSLAQLVSSLPDTAGETGVFLLGKSQILSTKWSGTLAFASLNSQTPFITIQKSVMVAGVPSLSVVFLLGTSYSAAGLQIETRMVALL